MPDHLTRWASPVPRQPLPPVPDGYPGTKLLLTGVGMEFYTYIVVGAKSSSATSRHGEGVS